MDAPPQPGGPAVVGDLHAELAVGDGVGDLEGAGAQAGRGLAEGAGDGLADQQPGRLPVLGAAGQGVGDEPPGGGNLIGAPLEPPPLRGRRNRVVRWHRSPHQVEGRRNEP
jgi:hypothetical protein